MAETRSIVLLGQNMVFLGRVESLAEPQGYETLRATTEAGFWRHWNNQRPALVLVDLEGQRDVWQKVLADLNPQKEGVKVVAFGPHEDVAGMEEARKLGCDQALSKGEFNRELPNIIAGLTV